MCRLLCYGAQVSYSYIANDGTTSLKQKDDVKEALKVIETFFAAMHRIRMVFTFRSGKQVFRNPHDRIVPFLREVTHCSIAESGVVQLEADFLLHTVNYYKFILL